MATRTYGGAHRKLRQELDALVQAGGVECWRCGEDIKPGAPWDLGHDDLDRDQYRGPEHQRCNRATKGRAPNQPAAIPFAPSGRCAPRACDVCMSEYRPSYSGQRTCGRACGVELRRRNHPPVARKPRQRPIPLKVCPTCGVEHRTPRRKYCSDGCMWEANARSNRDRYRSERGLPVDPSRPTEPRTLRAVPILKR